MQTGGLIFQSEACVYFLILVIETKKNGSFKSKYIKILYFGFFKIIIKWQMYFKIVTFKSSTVISRVPISTRSLSGVHAIWLFGS